MPDEAKIIAPHMAKLRPDQTRVVSEVRAHYEAGTTRVLVAAWTGSGKSVIATAMLIEAAKRGIPSMFVVNRTVILRQVARQLRELGIDRISMIAGDAPNGYDPSALIHLANSAAVRNRVSPNIVQLIEDEAHHVLSATNLWLREQLAPRFICGFTGTPVRLDRKPLCLAYDALVVGAQPSELVEKGLLARARVFSNDPTRRADVNSTPLKGNDFDPQEAAKRVNTKQLVGDIVEHLERRAADLPAIVFACNLDHSKSIVEACNAAGIPAEHVDGTMNETQRKAVMDRVRSGETRVISNFMLWCLDEETEILTSSGWKGINEIDPSHGVAGWRGGRIVFEKPSAIIVRDRDKDERMVSVRSTRADFRVTENHGLLFRSQTSVPEFAKKEALEIVGKKGLMPSCGIAEPFELHVDQSPPLTTKRFNRLVSAMRYKLWAVDGIPRELALEEATRRVRRKTSLRRYDPHELMLDECRFIGFWIGDGCRAMIRGGGIEYKFSQSHTYPIIIKWFEDLIARLGYSAVRRDRAAVPSKLTPNGGAMQAMWSLCRGTGGGSQERAGLFSIEPYLEKNGTDLFWGLSKEQYAALVEGLWYADGMHGPGTKQDGRALIICGANKQLFDLLQAVGVSRGFRCIIRLGGNPKIDPRFKQNYFLTISKGKDVPFVTKTASIEPVWKHERVWCVQVPSGNIVTRRHGRVVVTGNCEGIDMPELKCAVLARPTLSITIYLQSIGRVVRPYEGLNAVILDHVGNVERFGLPQADREWSIEPPKRRKKGGGPAPVKRCECGAEVALGVRVCPECGFAFPPPKELATVDGELVEVTKATDARAATEAAKRAAFNRFWMNSYKDGFDADWVTRRFAERFGDAPPADWAPPARPPITATPAQRPAQFVTWLGVAQRNKLPHSWAVEKYRNRYLASPDELNAKPESDAPPVEPAKPAETPPALSNERVELEF